MKVSRYSARGSIFVYVSYMTARSVCVRKVNFFYFIFFNIILVLESWRERNIYRCCVLLLYIYTIPMCRVCYTRLSHGLYLASVTRTLLTYLLWCTGTSNSNSTSSGTTVCPALFQLRSTLGHTEPSHSHPYSHNKRNITKCG